MPLIWVGFTVLSPLAAFVCWYAKGEGYAALLISSLLMADFFNMAFAFGWGYLDLRSALELLVLAGAVAALQKPAIGRVTGAEYQFIEIEGERYVAEWSQEEKLPFSGADRGKYLGRVTDGNITMRVFSVKGDESGKFLYALWDWEGEFYIRE